MNESTVAHFIMIIILFLTFLILSWYFIHRIKVKERLLFLEKGIDIPNEPFRFNFPWLKIGIVLSSASLGLLLGVLTESSKKILSDYYQGLLPSTFIFLFGGIGMIIAHFVDKAKTQR